MSTSLVVQSVVSKLAKERDGQGISQRALGRKLEHFSVSAISHMEVEGASPTLLLVLDICDKLDVKLSDLLRECDA